MSVNPPTSGPYPSQSTTSLNQASQEPTPGSCLPVFLGVLLVFCYIVAAVVFANFMPKIGPENLGTKLLVEGWPLIVGLLVLPVWISCLWNARANFAGKDTSRWRKWALILTLVEVSSFMQVPLQAAKPVTDAISGPDVIAIKGCDNYSQTEVDRYISHSLPVNVKLLSSTPLSLTWLRPRVRPSTLNLRTPRMSLSFTCR